MLNNCNNQEKNNNFCKVILTIISILVFGGFIFLFIKPLIGILSIIIAGGLNLYLNKRFPNFVKEIKKDNKKVHTAEAWAKKYKVKHIQGVNFADFEQTLDLTINKNELIFSEQNKELLNINNSEINNLEILEELEQTQKNKSVIARAIVGGLLLGGVGAVVGGLSGACPTLKTNKKYYLEITTNGPDKVIITTDNNSLKQIKTTIYNQIKG